MVQNVSAGASNSFFARTEDDASTLERGTSRTPLACELVVLEPNGLDFYPLPDSGTRRIGRAPDCDVRLSDPVASRHHATLELDPLAVTDDGSANGTLLDGTALEPGVRVPLSAGQTLRIGSTLLVVRRAVTRRSCAPTSTGEQPSVVGSSAVVLDPKMVELYEMLGRLARGTISVLILGDTGVGKELVAETLHHASLRSAQAFVKVNCATLAEPLLESELFGHERGAFTGAVTARQGLIELADGGTFFLDEVGELSAALQAKLLRVLETGELMRVGGSRTRRVDVRFVAATNRDLGAAVAAGTFRADLLYRLSGASVRVPALRERTSEILPLAEAFVARAAAELDRPVPPLSAEAREQLLAYDFPGNVRELKNAVERALLLCSGTLSGKDLSLGAHAWSMGAPCTGGTIVPEDDRPSHERSSLSEKERIVGALLKHGGNQTRAARDLGLPRRTLVRRIAELGIPRPRDDT